MTWAADRGDLNGLLDEGYYSQINETRTAAAQRDNTDITWGDRIDRQY
jgi:hypothetical protein